MTKKVLAILGDFYHDEALAKQSFELAIQEIDRVDLKYTTVGHLVESLKSKPDLVVLFAENRLNPEDAKVNTWMDGHAVKAIRDYVNDGGGWLAWHSGLASYEKFTDYTAMLHGYFEHHPVEHRVVTYSASGSSIIHSNEKFEFLDEHYFVTCDEENTNVFLRSESVDGSSTAGWEHPFGKGRVICLTPAHLKEGLLHPSLIKLLVTSIKLGCNLEHTC